MGDVGGVHVAEAGGLGRDLAGGEELRHLVPVDDAVGLAGGAAAVRRPRRTLATSHVETLPVTRPQGDVADGLVAEPAVEQVLADEQLARSRWLERVEVDVPGAQAGARRSRGWRSGPR